MRAVKDIILKGKVDTQELDKAQHHFDAAQDFFWEAGRKFGEFLEALVAGLCETSSYLAESVGDLASFFGVLF